MIVESQAVQISVGLSEHVSPEKLRVNAQNYPEMQLSLSSVDERRLTDIHAILGLLPLVHSTNRSRDELSRGLLPYSQKPEEYLGHTGDLDTSLGLDEYSFLHWGAAEKSQYGRSYQLVNPNTIHEATCIATPYDIGSLVCSISRPFELLEPDLQERVQKGYFDKMVTGTDWKEIIARRLLLHAKRTGGEPFELASQATLGEVKVFGGIDTKNFGQYLEPEDEHCYWAKLLGMGFVPGPVSRGLQFSSGSYDVKPEAIGSSIEVARQVWRSILAVNI